MPTLVVDFDGTLARDDVGDALCDRFAPRGWEAAGEAWRRGELTLPEAQRRMWSRVRANPATLRNAARDYSLRDGAERLLAAARAGELELILASGGFRLYIEEILGPDLEVFTAVYCNELVADGEGVRPEFPLTELAAPPYAICKARVLARHPGAFAGDGSSDRSAVDAAASVFTVRGSLLEAHCNDRGVPHVSFESFDTVLDRLLR